MEGGGEVSTQKIMVKSAESLFPQHEGTKA